MCCQGTPQSHDFRDALHQSNMGPEKAKASPALHAFSGEDITGHFARVGKLTWFKLFLEADDDIIRALSILCDDTGVSENVLQP